MRTLAAATAMATVLTVSAAAKPLLKNLQRLLPDYISSSALKARQNFHLRRYRRVTGTQCRRQHTA
jgi:hypothetical protein